MSLEDFNPSEVRKELSDRMNELMNLRSDGVSRKIYLVPKYWHDNLLNWLKDPSNPPPGPIDNSILCHSNNDNNILIKEDDEFDINKKYKKDFMIVEAKIWLKLCDLFTCKIPITRRLSVHPITSCTCVLLVPVIFEMHTSKGPIIKTCSSDWLIGEIRRPLCSAYRFVFKEHIFVSFDTNEVIDDQMTIGDYAEKYGTKVKLVELNSTINIKGHNNYSSSPNNRNKSIYNSGPDPSNNTNNSYNNKGTMNSGKNENSSNSGNSSLLGSSVIKSVISPSKNNHNNFCSVNSINSENNWNNDNSINIVNNSINSVNNGNNGNSGNRLISTMPHLTFQSNDAKMDTLVVNQKCTGQRHSNSTFQIKEPQPVGLVNLGNTCFFNASIQCIIRIPPLFQYCMSPNFNAAINRNNPRGSGGTIATEFAAFLEMMSTSSPNAARDPRNLRKAIMAKYKEFENYKQHDAQEMVGAILDGLHEDLFNGESKARDINTFNTTNNANGNSNEGINNIVTVNNLNRVKNVNDVNIANATNRQNNATNADMDSRVSFSDNNLDVVNSSNNGNNNNGNNIYDSVTYINNGINESILLNPDRLLKQRLHSSHSPSSLQRRCPKSIVEELFYGQLETRTTCPNCKEVETVNDPFLFLSVPIPQNVIGDVDLMKCVEKFLKSGQLDENNKWKCPKCNINVCAYQKMEIKSVSRVIIIHLKRFESYRGQTSKVDTKVVYPNMFNIAEIAPRCVGTYKLMSVIYHTGNLYQGHYTASAIDPKSGKWFSFNDTYTSATSANAILSSRAYILFYMRVEK